MFERVWGELRSKKITWDKLEFSHEIAHYEKSLIAIFGKIFASLNKIFIFPGRVGTSLSFYGV